MNTGIVPKGLISEKNEVNERMKKVKYSAMQGFFLKATKVIKSMSQLAN
jgi:hypothetical protein